MTEDKYEVRSCVPEAAIRVCRTKDPQLTLKITLSSLTMREEHGSRQEGIDPPYHHPSSCFWEPSFIWPSYKVGVGGALRHVKVWMKLELYRGLIWGRYLKRAESLETKRDEMDLVWVWLK